MNRIFYECGKIVFFILLVAVFAVAFGGLGWLSDFDGCVFKSVTGLYCPGCGGTRACLSLLHFQFLKSICYHPAVLYFTLVYLVFMGKMFLLKHFHIGTEKEGRLPVFIFIGIGIILVQWIVKLICQLVFHISWL